MVVHVKKHSKYKYSLGESFKLVQQHNLLSLEIEISVKMTELFRISTRSVPEFHEYRHASQSNVDDGNIFPNSQEIKRLMK